MTTAFEEAKRWEALFSKQQSLRYAAEDRDRLQFDRNDKRSLVDALCLVGKSSSLEPPGDFFFSPLRQFLDNADIAILNHPSFPGDFRVQLDERQDNQSDSEHPRTWDSSAHSYFMRPPAGLQAVSASLDLPALYSILSENVCR